MDMPVLYVCCSGNRERTRLFCGPVLVPVLVPVRQEPLPNPPLPTTGSDSDENLTGEIQQATRRSKKRKTGDIRQATSARTKASLVYSLPRVLGDK